MKNKTYLNFIVTLFLCVIGSLFNATYAQSENVLALEKELSKIKTTLSTHYDVSGVRGTMLSGKAADILVGKKALAYIADSLGLKVEQPEIRTVQLMLLADQGLVDLTKIPESFEEDHNILAWLKGQQYTLEDFDEMATTLALWMKIATREVPEITTTDIENYLRENPGVGVIPQRMKFKITYYNPGPSSNGTRSAWQAAIPSIALAVRSGDGEQMDAPNEWENIELSLPLDGLDPNLRDAISGKKAGDIAGPVLLDSEASMSIEIVEILDESNIADTGFFNEFIAMQIALHKADQKDLFEEIVNTYLDNAPADVRGFWRKIFKGLKYVTAAAGGVIGGLATGSWAGVTTGAQIGWQVGKSINSVYENFAGPPSSQSVQTAYQNYQNNSYQIPQNPGWNYASTRQAVPVSYQTPQYYNNPYRPVSMPYIPQMPQGYNAYPPPQRNGYGQGYWNFPVQAPYPIIYR